MPSEPLPRYFRSDQSPTKRDPYKQLVASLKRLIVDYPPKRIRPRGGFYHGPISIALLLFRIKSLYPSLTIEGHHLGTWASTYLRAVKEHEDQFPEPSPSHCGISNDRSTLLALEAANSKDTQKAMVLCEYSSVIVHDTAADNGDAANEWLYGRAGYLYLLRLVRNVFGDHEETTHLINNTAKKVIKTILDSPRPWVWHRKNYLGAAHGSIGIITQVILTDPTHASNLEGELQNLLDLQCTSGNWPSSEPVGKDRLVQFCHGATGFVTSLQSIVDYLPDPGLKERVARSIQRGQECILERGLLTKEPCLCHGISGNALVLGDPTDFDHFLSLTTGGQMDQMSRDKMMERSRDGEGLWTGEAGRAWAWAVADKGLGKRFLGYNDL